TRIRVGTKTELVAKPFGVLNFESPAEAAFSTFHESCAVILAQQVGRVLERLEWDNKLEKLRRRERSLANARNWDTIVDAVLKEIRETLGYEYVTMSLIDVDTSLIRCYRVLGIEDAAEFRQVAVYDLRGSNIQADIVRTRQTEVPAANDPR